MHSAVITAPLAPPSRLTHSFTVSGTLFAALPPIPGTADVGERGDGEEEGAGDEIRGGGWEGDDLEYVKWKAMKGGAGEREMDVGMRDKCND